MAASTITDKELLQVGIEGYVRAYLPEQLSLGQSGIVRTDLNPPFSASAQGGNSYMIKGRIYDATVDAAPVADTAPTTTAISSWKQNGVIVRRVKMYGNEDLASVAGGEGTDEWMSDIANVIVHNKNLNVEVRMIQKLIPGVFGSTGPLYATHTVDNSGSAFDYSMFAQGMAKMGENAGALDAIVMHSAVFWGAQVNSMLTAQPDYNSIAAFRALGVQFVGMIGNKRVFINDRCYTTGGVYDTILAGPNALYYADQLANSIEIFRSNKASGTTEVLNRSAYSIAVAGVSFSGTLPTGLGGATDAEPLS